MSDRLTVPQRHQLKIARDTLIMSDAGALIMGGPSRYRAAEIVWSLTRRCTHPVGLNLNGDCPVCGSGA